MFFKRMQGLLLSFILNCRNEAVLRIRVVAAAQAQVHIFVFLCPDFFSLGFPDLVVIVNAFTDGLTE